MSLKTHKHGPTCPPDCAREHDVDAASATGAYRIVTRQEYGRRPVDKPRWWPFAFTAYKAMIQVCTVLGLAWLAKRLGLTVGAP